jgi:hypothetical protein
MSSLTDNFEELMARIKRGREVGHASFEPIYYLVFKPSEILEVKRKTPTWKVKLEKEGWQVHCFSIADQIQKIWQADPRRLFWMRANHQSTEATQKANESLANALENGKRIQEQLEKLLAEVDCDRKSIVFVTDLEALHPYLRIGAIESQLHGKFSIPTVFFYPGTREGKTSLSFLSFYPPDGNYRSVHVGG